jgi:hypothetical protein
MNVAMDEEWDREYWARERFRDMTLDLALRAGVPVHDAERWLAQFTRRIADEVLARAESGEVSP